MQRRLCRTAERTRKPKHPSPRYKGNTARCEGFLLTLYGSVGEQQSARALLATTQSSRIKAVVRASQPCNHCPEHAAVIKVFFLARRVRRLSSFSLSNTHRFHLNHPSYCRWIRFLLESRWNTSHVLEGGGKKAHSRASPSYGAATFYSTVFPLSVKKPFWDRRAEKPLSKYSLRTSQKCLWIREAVKNTRFLPIRLLLLDLV